MLAKLLSLFALPAALAFPFGPRADLTSLSSIQTSSFSELFRCLPCNCDVSSIAVPLANQSTLAAISGETTSAIGIGRGVQNYTCTSGAYVTAGALANLYDVSCLFSMSAGSIDPASLSSVLPQVAFSSLSYPDTTGLPVMYHHFFVTTPGSSITGAISPEFASNSDNVILSKTATLTDPVDSTTNVAWLQLTAIAGQGTLAKSAYRINTVNGQPPSSCTTEGETLSVQYAAAYWFTK